MGLKIALVGYGSMGKEIEKLTQDKDIQITDIFDIDNPIKDGDYSVAIEFTQPDSVMQNIEKLANLKKNIVLGTTGWYGEEYLIKEIVKANDIGLVWASNFSIGMQLFFQIIEHASKLINSIEDYDIFMHEFHHKRKKDSPSGTAETISQILLNNINRKKKAQYKTSERKINPEQLHVTSTRGGEVPGTHSVYLDSIADTIELTHRARNRSGFALGAIKAAELIDGKKGFFKFDDLLQEIIG